MAWQKIDGYAAFVGIQPSGRVEWNDATQSAMDDPESVEVFHDSVNNRLGLRRLMDHRGDPHCLKVRVTTNPDTGLEVNSVEAFQHLANMGVSVASLYAAALQDPVADSEQPGIYWIALP